MREMFSISGWPDCGCVRLAGLCWLCLAMNLETGTFKGWANEAPWSLEVYVQAMGKVGGDSCQQAFMDIDS